MTLHRFYYPSLVQDRKHILLSDKKELHHLSHVLCFKKNEKLIVFNGHGLEALGTINALSKTNAEISLHHFSHHLPPLKPSLVLACAIPKKSKFETIIEKGTELGIDRIIPLKTTRTEIASSLESLGRKQKRYLEVAINASKQSQRSFLPEIQSVTSFKEMLSTMTTNDIGLLGSLRENQKRLMDIPFDQFKKANAIFIIIGPEGDFTDEEIDLALEKGCLPITLGPNILKVETAALSMISYLILLLRS